MNALVPKPIWHEFYPGINTLLSQTHDERSLDTNARVFFAEWIYDYILMISETAQSTNRKIGVKEMENAIRAKLGPELASFAHSEGLKNAILYWQGRMSLKKDDEDLHPLVYTGYSPSYWNRSLHYGPVKEPGVVVVEQQVQEDFSNVFNNGIKRFASTFCDGYELDERATNLMNDLLENVCSELARTSVSKAPPKRKTVGPAEVESAIKDTLRGEMVTFAINEGRKTLVLYGNGLVTLPKLKPQQQQQQSTAKKRKVCVSARKPIKRSSRKLVNPKRIPTIDFTPEITALAEEMKELMVFDTEVGPARQQPVIDLQSSGLVDKMNALTIENIEESIEKKFHGEFHAYAVVEVGKRTVFPNPDAGKLPAVITQAK